MNFLKIKNEEYQISSNNIILHYSNAFGYSWCINIEAENDTFFGFINLDLINAFAIVTNNFLI
jgi:hypothetical protein